MAKSKADKPETKSLASLWDGADVNKATNRPSEGEHEMRVDEVTVSEKEGKPTLGLIKMSIIDGEEEGKSISSRYYLTEEDGSEGQGLPYFKRDLGLLGYEISGAKLEKTLKEITEDQPMVVARIKVNGQYANAYIQGLADTVGKKAKDDDDDSSPDAEVEEIEEGDTVTGLNSEEEKVTGKVIKIKKGKATVKDEDDDEHVISVEDLEKVKEGEEETEGSEELNVGDTVTDGDVTGELKKIKGDKAYVEDADGDTHKVDLEDLKKAEEKEEEKEEDFSVGDKVKFDDDGTVIKGKIKKLKGDKATIVDSDGDEHMVDVTDLERR